MVQKIDAQGDRTDVRKILHRLISTEFDSPDIAGFGSELPVSAFSTARIIWVCVDQLERLPRFLSAARVIPCPKGFLWRKPFSVSRGDEPVEPP